MANLYELSTAFEAVKNGSFVMDEETGEILFDSTNIEQLEETIDEKIDDIASWIKNIESLNVAIKAEKKALDKRISDNDKKVEMLESYLANAMAKADKKKFESARNKITFRKSSKLVITDEEKFIEDNFDADFIKTKTEHSVDKTMLKKMLNEGLQIDGVNIQTSNNISIK